MKVALVPNERNAQACESAWALQAWLQSEGIEAAQIPPERGGEAQVIDGADLIIALGGDGTTLRAARLVRYAETPILSFNYGTLGFMSSGMADEMHEALASVLSGELVPERRATLQVEVFSQQGEQSCFALNEVAISRALTGRIVDFSFAINGAHIANMRGDGIIVATATGSTAYALSAGGPIVAPGHLGLVVVPLAPHTLRSRSIVTGSSDCVEISFGEQDNRDARVFIDGIALMEPVLPVDGVGSETLVLQAPNTLRAPVIPDRIIVRRGSGDILLYQYRENGFYQAASRVFFN